ncbi:MAG: Na+/H+ antiporter subunit E [Elusimicrobia bacterium]|jgi:multicomponent Na+:H+ antiporter subunit E|nr:Na+/H+ antiporter subunit E [Elusimicrobiota bacterium]
MNKIISYLLIYIIWLLLSWPFNPLKIQDILVGLVVAFIPVILFVKKSKKSFSKSSSKLEIKRIGWAILYIPVLIYNMIIANFDVLYRIISPELPIKPGIVKINTTLKSSMARAILCNSITLTPGTLTVDIKEDIIYVHWINITTSSRNVATKKIAGRFEKILKKVFE